MNMLIQSSCASAGFKAGIESYLAGARTDRVWVESYVPRVKVQRLLSHLLETESALEIESVAIRGYSGCSDFVGSIDVRTPSGDYVYDFVWCCRWRAETEGYVDYFGSADQARAAQEFDWRCFQHWERRRSS